MHQSWPETRSRPPGNAKNKDLELVWLKIEIHQRYALKDAGQALRDLEARKTTGSTILVP
jgi:hypothetical protein